MKLKTFKHASGCKAFTLLELLCVLGILGIVLCLLTLQAHQLHAAYLDRLAVEQVMKDMRYAQAQARRTGQPATLMCVMSEPNQYRILYQGLNQEQIREYRKLPKDIQLKTKARNQRFAQYSSKGSASIFVTASLYRGSEKIWDVIPYKSGQIRAEKAS